MDDQNHSQYSRVPELEDLINLCRDLNNEKVKYMLIGGFAVILHGFVRGTKDIDLLVESSRENIHKLKKAMSKLPDKAVLQVNDGDVIKYQVVRVADEIVVDLMSKAGGIDYKTAVKEVEHKIIESVKIPVASKHILIKMKETFRNSDKMDVDYLKYRIDAEKKKE